MAIHTNIFTNKITNILLEHAFICTNVHVHSQDFGSGRYMRIQDTYNIHIQEYRIQEVIKVHYCIGFLFS